MMPKRHKTNDEIEAWKAHLPKGGLSRLLEENKKKKTGCDYGKK